MGVTKGGANLGTCGLEPFVFDPGKVPSQNDLRKMTEDKILSDRTLKDAIKKRKEGITGIMQGCLDEVNEQLEKGEAICSQAHFPLLNPIAFDDLEALAQHDFTVSLHKDKVDDILQEFVAEILRIFWSNTRLENRDKALALERHNEAMLNRMETLEHHLVDRSRQLANCRFAYFLEVTHLRNQVYRKDQEGLDFEATEAYYFDPTEFLEEELREQLNDKIKLSVKVYCEKLAALKRYCENLEAKLDAMKGDPTKGGVKGATEFIVNRFGCPDILTALNEMYPEEMAKWALEKNPGGADEQIKKLLAEKAGMQREIDELRNAADLKSAELKKDRGSLMNMEDELRKLRESIQQDTANRPLVASPISEAVGACLNPGDVVMSASDLKLRDMELQKLRDELEKLRRSAEAENKEASKVAELQKQTNDHPEIEGRRWKEADRLSAEEIEKLQSYETMVKVCETIKAEHEGTNEPGMPKAAVDRFRKIARRAMTLSRMGNSKVFKPRASSECEDLPEEVGWVAQAFGRRADRCAELEAEIERLHAELAAKDNKEDSASEHSEGQREISLARPKSPPTQPESEPTAVVQRQTAPTGGTSEFPDRDAQTNITGVWDGGFYLLEFPRTEAELAVETELEDLKSCAMGNWEATLEQIRASQRPPRGHGSGFCARGSFIRLFQGAAHRIAREDELVAMCQLLKRAELERVLDGIHLLQESSLPDEESMVRDAIFGRGITEQNLCDAEGQDFELMAKSWLKQVDKVLATLHKRDDEIELGLHTNRRIFVPGGGAGVSNSKATVSWGCRHVEYPGVLTAAEIANGGPLDDAGPVLRGRSVSGTSSGGRDGSVERIDAGYIIAGGRVVPRAGRGLNVRGKSPNADSTIGEDISDACLFSLEAVDRLGILDSNFCEFLPGQRSASRSRSPQFRGWSPRRDGGPPRGAWKSIAISSPGWFSEKKPGFKISDPEIGFGSVCPSIDHFTRYPNIAVGFGSSPSGEMNVNTEEEIAVSPLKLHCLDSVTLDATTEAFKVLQRVAPRPSIPPLTKNAEIFLGNAPSPSAMKLSSLEPAQSRLRIALPTSDDTICGPPLGTLEPALSYMRPTLATAAGATGLNRREASSQPGCLLLPSAAVQAAQTLAAAREAEASTQPARDSLDVSQKLLEATATTATGGTTATGTTSSDNLAGLVLSSSFPALASAGPRPLGGSLRHAGISDKRPRTAGSETPLATAAQERRGFATPAPLYNCNSVASKEKALTSSAKDPGKLRAASASKTKGGDELRLRLVRPSTANIGPRSCDIEEPMAEPAPRPTTASGRYLLHSQSAPMSLHKAADIEQMRKHLNDGGDRVPVPSWEYEQRVESRQRPVGGRHTKTMIRPEPRFQQPGSCSRPATAGQAGARASSCGQVPDGGADVNAQATTSPALMAKTLGIRRGRPASSVPSRPGSRGSHGGVNGARTPQPAVRIAALPGLPVVLLAVPPGDASPSSGRFNEGAMLLPA